MRLQNSAAAESKPTEEYLSMMGEAKIRIDGLSKHCQTEEEIISQMMLLDSAFLLIMRISDRISEDIKVLPGYRERFQVH